MRLVIYNKASKMSQTKSYGTRCEGTLPSLLAAFSTSLAMLHFLCFFSAFIFSLQTVYHP